MQFGNGSGLIEMFQEYDLVRLLTDLHDNGIPKGSVGTVLNIPDPEEAIPHYVIEFVDDNGNSLGTPIVSETILERCAELQVG